MMMRDDAKNQIIKKRTRSLYQHNLKIFCSEQNDKYTCRFAESSFAMGEMYRKGIGVKEDLEKAYHYYLQAEYAFKKRMQVSGNIHDTGYFARVQILNAQLKNVLSYDLLRIYESKYPSLIGQALDDGYEIMVSFKRLKSNRIKITAARMNRTGEDYNGKMLITHPYFHYCQFQEYVVTYADGDTDYWSLYGDDCIRVDRLESVVGSQFGNRHEFYYRNKLVAYIVADSFVVNSKKKRYIPEKM